MAMLSEKEMIQRVLGELKNCSELFVRGGTAKQRGALCLQDKAQLTMTTHGQTTNLPTRGENTDSLKYSVARGTRKVWDNFEVKCNGMEQDCPLWYMCAIADGKWYTEPVTDVEKIHF